ncbi:MAG: hypothetical protein JJT76_18870 [Clostridiaceae bacterium]|nr:hypothetical protein [Clostridiaceae bacterium]
MSRKKVLAIIFSTIAPFISYFYYFNKSNVLIGFFSINNLVGVVAILSGLTGIVMGIASSRQANLDAVKEYFQQGDEDSYSEARGRILKAENVDQIESSDVSKICNFFHFWGLMNRQRYLPIWVFEGSSGLQIVKLYMKLKPIIIKKRKNNKFYAVEFELLAYRIYKKYKMNFDDLSGIEWDELLSNFKKDFHKRNL